MKTDEKRVLATQLPSNPTRQIGSVTEKARKNASIPPFAGDRYARTGNASAAYVMSIQFDRPVTFSPLGLSCSVSSRQDPVLKLSQADFPYGKCHFVKGEWEEMVMSTILGSVVPGCSAATDRQRATVFCLQH